MPKKVKSGEILTPNGSTDIENEIRELVDHVLKEPKIPTMGKKLIVEASTPGHYPGLLWEHFGIKNMPPCSIEEQASAIIECVKAGAAAIHTHPRDPSAPYCCEAPVSKSMSPELMAKILDKVYQEVDVVPLIMPGTQRTGKTWQRQILSHLPRNYSTSVKEISTYRAMLFPPGSILGAEEVCYPPGLPPIPLRRVYPTLRRTMSSLLLHWIWTALSGSRIT